MADDSSGSQTRKNLLLIVVGLLIVGSAWNYLASRPKGIGEAPLWFYDLSTHKLVRSKDALPPVAGKSGQLVRAYVYACGDCADEKARYVGYLERFSDEAKASLKQHFKIERYLGPKGIEALDPEQLKGLPPLSVQYHAPPGLDAKGKPAPDEWFDAYSPEAVALAAAARNHCGPGKTPTDCSMTEFVP